MSLDLEEAPEPPESFRRLLEAEARRFGLDHSEPVLASLSAYLAELDVWRRRVNLTGQLSASELASHASESILGSSLIAHGERVVDIGSGAGFPGLPLAISRPDLEVALVEPRTKRCAFLRHVVRTLRLATVRVIEARIENVSERFDVAATRAVGRFPQWLAGAPFLSHVGLLLVWTTNAENVQSTLGSGFRSEQSIAIPGSLRRVVAAFRRAA